VSVRLLPGERINCLPTRGIARRIGNENFGCTQAAAS
jgi:hypothetical protein